MSSPGTPVVPPGHLVEVDTLERFDVLAGSTSAMAGWRLQSLDLRERGARLRRLDPAGAVFLGCDLTDTDEDSLRDRGALLFPAVPDLPFDAYRGTLYTAEELYAELAGGYDRTPDAAIYAWSRTPAATGDDVAATLAQSLHDHAVEHALRDYAAAHRLVGVMGGHAVSRGTEQYAEAARLGQRLARAGLTVATGGGPGAMEAANLGARAASLTDAELDAALARLASVPDFTPSIQAWAEGAFDVLAGLPEGPATLGIPTWYYGHEPPNAFASDIAKFFANALREDTLLRVCTAGIVFLPGAAGTVQEVFQDACENYYATPANRAPMVLVGREHWTRTLPVWPLLEALAEAKDFACGVSLVDSAEDVLDALG
jgi:predicted Rossmann-fold nucleotide-binding protein